MNNSSISNIAGKLLLVCLVSSGLVAWTYQSTLPNIKAKQEQLVQASYQEVLPQAQALNNLAIPNNSLIQAIVQSKGTTINGYIYTVTPTGYAGPITTMIGINHPEGTISGIKILQQSETPGLGAKCAEPSFTNQFTSKTLNADLKVTKTTPNEQEILAITASTITSKAVVTGVNLVREHYNTTFRKEE